MPQGSKESSCIGIVDRRTFLAGAMLASVVPRIPLLSMQLAPDMSRSLTKDERDGMTPSQVLGELKKGNERFGLEKWRRGTTWARSDPVRLGSTQPRLYSGASIHESLSK
ncbi:MAG TPA: hypothetical protein VMG82_11500 [Candidatus Sulfotelmatobacter sp.]|nr:hypothetical protein [Candidatus Sulfotelmatobacter sp.]